MPSNTSERSGQAAAEGGHGRNQDRCDQGRHDAVLNGGDATVAKTLAGESANIFKHYNNFQKRHRTGNRASSEALRTTSAAVPYRRQSG